METFFGGLLAFLLAILLLYQRSAGNLRLTLRASLYLWLLLISGLLFMGESISKLQPSPQPTPYPTIPPISTTPAPIPTPTDSCLLWSQVTAQMEGRTVCIYGTVTNHTEDYTNELTRFYFGTIDQFFLVSNYRWEKTYEGECVTTTGEILLNTYQVPYIKIDDLDSCPSSFIIHPS